jgi:F-type H+-transporting ATPase subunit a
MAEAESNVRHAEATEQMEQAFNAGEHAMHHILDKVLVGIDAKTGGVTMYPYDEHGHPKSGYEPKVLATVLGKPVRMEFTKHMFGMTIAAILIFMMATIVAKRVLANLKVDKAPKGGLANAFEAIISYIRDEIVEPVGGHHLGHYTPLFITYFIFILFLNLLGLVPEYGGVTGNAAVTLAMGGSIYALIWILGMYNQGPVNFVLHLVPPGTPLWMWPLMFVLELLGPLIKCFVLCVRLFANMIAGHLIVGTVLGLGAIGAKGTLSTGLAIMMLGIGIPLSLMITGLDVLVCFIQAYVFTLLAVIFIGGAVHPEH